MRFPMTKTPTEPLLGRPALYALMAAVLLAAAAYRLSNGEPATAGFALSASAGAACCAGEAWTGRRAFLWIGGACVFVAMVFLRLAYS